MSTQNIVGVTKVHGYKCPVCEWWFDTTDSEDRIEPKKGYYFDVEMFNHDECGDIFSSSTKIIKGVERVTCHRTEDDSDYTFCDIDMSTFKVTECQGWKCEGCGVEAWYDNENCTQHSYSHESGASRRAKEAVMTGCGCKKSTDPVPVPDTTVTVHPLPVGTRVKVLVDRPLMANLYAGNEVTITDVRTNRYTVKDDSGVSWGVDHGHVAPLEVKAEPADPRPLVGSEVMIAENNADGVDWQKGEIVTVTDWHGAPDFLRVQRKDGRVWNLDRHKCKVVEPLTDDIADKFVRKLGEKKTTVLDF